MYGTLSSYLFKHYPELKEWKQKLQHKAQLKEENIFLTYKFSNQDSNLYPTTLKVIEYYAALGEWQKVEDLVFASLQDDTCPLSYTLAFYRAWIEALNASFNISGLKQLGYLLFRLRKTHVNYLGLALLCFTYAQQEKYARLIFNYCTKYQLVTPWIFESQAIFLCTYASDRKTFQKGLRMLHDFCQSRASTAFAEIAYWNYMWESSIHTQSLTFPLTKVA